MKIVIHCSTDVSEEDMVEYIKATIPQHERGVMLDSVYTIDEYADYLGEITSGLDETELTAKEVIDYMYKHDEMPEGVSLWEELEYSSPAYLAKQIL